ncbi:pupal cuticle protein-like [Rhynchophorus ferrugineus]|uniref:Uncharacterized protein n=1 Tax=Rhynchophorus ferrugineus TaxID=354439 RepID=A0A834IQL2_RHYFE|nr:hypothetical protein GWI33_010658 [Rhynchophorus ferrugineus]
MYKLAIVGVLLTFVLNCHSQYQGDSEAQRRPPPQILTHKQALNHDGNFKYLFTSENGLAQGESIAPDGTRTGGYSYIDPNGKKISVKYVAGKEGFKILEADHLPKAPQPIGPVPQPQQTEESYQQPQSQSYDDGKYRAEPYTRPQQTQAYYQPVNLYRGNGGQASPLSNQINEKEQELSDEPGKPGTFGSGYIFEFGSG